MDLALKRFARCLVDPRVCISAYLTFFMLHQIQVVNWFLGGVQTVLVAWSAVVLVFLFIKQREYFYCKPLWWFVPVIGAALISLVANYQVELVSQVKTFILLVLAGLLFLPMGRQIAESSNRMRDAFVVFFASMFIIFVQGILSIVMLVLRFAFRATIDGRFVEIGMLAFNYTQGHVNTYILFGMNVNSNHAVVYGFIGLMLSYWFYRHRSAIFGSARACRAFELYFWINLVLQLIYVVLANSRGAHYSIALALVVFMPLATLMLTRSRRIALRLGLAVGMTLVSLMLFAGLVASVEKATQVYMGMMPGLVYDETIRPSGNLGEDSEGTQAAQVDYTKGSLLHTQRLYLWKEAIELWQHHPITGIGAYTSAHYAKTDVVFADTHYLEKGKAIHNAYLDVLVYYGIIGFIAYVGYFGYCFTRLVKRIRRRETDIDDLLLGFMLLVVLGTQFFLTDAFIGLDYTAAIIFMVMTYLACRSNVSPQLEPRLVWTSCYEAVDREDCPAREDDLAQVNA